MVSEQENAALAIIAEAMQQAEQPYIAFSGGKDSLVVAHLVSRFCHIFRVAEDGGF